MAERDNPEQMTVREWRLRRDLRERMGIRVADAMLVRPCDVCGWDGLRHDFDCPMRDRV